MWSSLVISTASWQSSSAVKTELQALPINEATAPGLVTPSSSCVCACMYMTAWCFVSAVPEFELAAHLSVLDLYELIVAGWHAAVLHKPLEAKQG